MRLARLFFPRGLDTSEPRLIEYEAVRRIRRDTEGFTAHSPTPHESRRVPLIMWVSAPSNTKACARLSLPRPAYPTPRTDRPEPWSNFVQHEDDAGWRLADSLETGIMRRPLPIVTP